MSFLESAIPLHWFCFRFFCLVCKLFDSDLQIRNLILDISRYMDSVYISGHILHDLIQKINFNWNPLFLTTFCWSINCIRGMSLSYKAYFRHFQKLKHYLYLRPFNLFSFKKGSILTIEYVSSFFLVVKLSLVCK